MRRFPTTTVVLVALTVLATVVAGCGGGETEVTEDTSTTTTRPPSTTTTRPPPREPCIDDVLAAAVQAEFPEATVADQSCSSTFAIATVDGPTTDPIVGYFQIGPDGRWVLLQVGEIESDQYADAPEGLPDSLVSTWRRAYGIRLEQGTPAP